MTAELSMHGSCVARAICKKLKTDKLPETARYMQTLLFYEYIMISRQSIMKYKWKPVWSVTGNEYKKQNITQWKTTLAGFLLAQLYEIKRPGRIHTESHFWRGNVTPNMSSSLSNSFTRLCFKQNKWRGFPTRACSNPVSWIFSVGFISQLEDTRPWVHGFQTMSRGLNFNTAGLLALWWKWI